MTLRDRLRGLREDWRKPRGLERADTALLLIVGGSLALAATGATYFNNQLSINHALSSGHRLAVYRAGYVLVIASIVSLVSLIEGFRGVNEAATKRLRRSQRSAAQPVGASTVGQSPPPTGAGLESKIDAKPVVYYLTVSVMVAGFWVLATATGGFTHTPSGLIFTSTVLFGQIRANQKRDIAILFVVAVIGCALSDTIGDLGWLHTCFARTSEVVISTRSWYWAVVLSFGISTWVNWYTFEEEP